MHELLIKRVGWKVALLAVALLTVACADNNKKQVDKWNDLAYDYHYRNLDSTMQFAKKACLLSAHGYDEGRAEAYNNMAFVCIAKMKYDEAFELLDSAAAASDSEVERLVADVQHMRLCQRQSQNKDFYTYRERASSRINRINEESNLLDERLRARMLYATSEFCIVNSTYYYYVGLEEKSINALNEVADESILRRDTAQWIAYLYNVGAGGIVTEGTGDEINQTEMDYLLRAHLLSIRGNYPFWEANTLQAISEHLIEPSVRDKLVADNLPAIRSINIDNMPDSLLAGNLAERSLQLFENYGDVYQIAGSYRTLAQCYWQINDYPSSLFCLNEALMGDTAINQAPDLVASIREQLSVVYAALDEKENSDYNRNVYLDLQVQTRQDRYLESRALILDKSLHQLNVMIYLILLLIALACALAAFLWYKRRNDTHEDTLNELMQPLETWEKENLQQLEAQQDQHDEIVERQQLAALHLANNKRRHLEQRAKAALVAQIMPFIDRMLHEIHRLAQANEPEEVRRERYAYVGELSDIINEYNQTLTQWIQLRQGDVTLHIESFPLNSLFNIVARGKTGFQLKGVTLDVVPTDVWVKADRILTLFMINTIADNARKFTPEGGKVTISAEPQGDYMEISVTDTGIGMTKEQILTAFSVEKKAFSEEGANDAAIAPRDKGHGFGLVNCKGIIEKYKKISSLFNDCSIGVESELGKGSRFFFRLPRGIAKWCVLLFGMSMGIAEVASAANDSLRMDTSVSVTTTKATYDAGKVWMEKAANWADSAYYCNTRHEYQMTLQYADSVRECLNAYYRLLCPDGNDLMQRVNEKAVALPEVNWFHNNLPFDYEVILDIRNESAVAALALHDWSLYRYNNKVYTQLFKEKSADTTLGEYCRVMQKSQTDKMVAVVLLVILLVAMAVAYFLFFYRHQVYYRFCIERVRDINNILLSDQTEEEKLRMISEKAGDLAKRKTPSDKGKTDSAMGGLQKVVGQVMDALRKSIEAKQKSLVNIEMANDELRKENYENDKFYVCNNVLDNCLSTLKHETMYYPARIKALVVGGDQNVQLLKEMASFYHELYSLLSTQASRQMETVAFQCRPLPLHQLLEPYIEGSLPETYVLADKELLLYLFEILKKANAKQKMPVSVEKVINKHVALEVCLEAFEKDSRTNEDLFYPSMPNLPFLLCRQIARECGEMANARGCGIVSKDNDGRPGITLTVTLPKWK